MDPELIARVRWMLPRRAVTASAKLHSSKAGLTVGLVLHESWGVGRAKMRTSRAPRLSLLPNQFAAPITCLWASTVASALRLGHDEKRYGNCSRYSNQFL